MPKTTIEIGLVDRASAGIKNIGGGINKLQAALGAVTGAVAVGAFRGIVDDLDRLQESAEAAGRSVASLQALRYAGSFSGLGVEQLDDALKKLNVRLDDAASGGKESAAIFKALGISVRNSSGQILSSDEALSQIAEKFSSFRDGPEKAALAVDLFGKQGTKLIPLLNQGASGLERLKKEAEELGIILGDKAVSNAAKFADQLDRLAAISRASSARMFEPLVESLIKVVEEFEAAQRAGLGFFGTLDFTFRNFSLTFSEASDKIREVNDNLRKERDAQKSSNDKAFIESRERVIAQLERQKVALQEIQRLRALAESGTPYSNEGLRGLPAVPRPKQGDKTKQEISEASRDLAQFVEQLDRRIDKTEDLTAVEEALFFLQKQGALGQIPQVRELVLLQAKRVDAAEQELGIKKALAQWQATELANARALDAQIDQFTGRAEQARAAALLARRDARLAAGEEFSADEIQKFNAAIIGTRGELEKTDDAVQQIGLSLVSSLGRWVEDPSQENFFKALIKDVSKLGLELLVLKPIAEDLMRTFKGDTAGDGKSGLFAIFKAAAAAFGGGGGGGGVEIFGDGGRPPVGRPSIVGDKGPELFVPDTAGTIVPNGAFGAPSIVQYINVDARSDRASILAAMRQATEDAKRQIMQSFRNNGSFARVVGA